MGIGKALALVAVIVFVLVGLDVTVGNLTQLEELSFGLAFLAASLVL
jgi:hypothetical protein